MAWLFEPSDIDTHFDHLNRANRLMAATRPYDPEATSQFVGRQIERFSPPAVAALAERSSQAWAPIFIVALPRSGTTLLEQMLGAHSQTACVGESAALRHALTGAANSGNPLARETPLADIDNIEIHLQDIARRFRANYFVRAVRERRVVDKSVGNFFNIGQLALVYPMAKIIALHRHPLDVIYSNYQQNFASGNNNSFRLDHLAEHYRLFHRIMQHWQAAFPGRMHVLRYEALVNNPEKELRQVLDFCDLSWEDDCFDYHSHVGLIKTASDMQARKPLYRDAVYKWKRVERHLEPAKRILGQLADYD